VNWFRQDDEGHFLWPGFGENLRVLRWIIDRCENRVGARETAIGFLPEPDDIDTNDLDIAPDTLQDLLAVNEDQWRDEMTAIGEYFESFGDRLPEALQQEHETIVEALAKTG
jgi:phosphoenolpyruvate carboxykinase (GTP)